MPTRVSARPQGPIAASARMELSMPPAMINRIFLAALLAGAIGSSACGSASGKAAEREPAPPPAIDVSPVAASERPISRYIRVTGTLMAEEHADVAAETSGRVVATPIERGTSVATGSELIRLSATETG